MIAESYAFLAHLFNQNPTRQLAIAQAWLDPQGALGYDEEAEQDPLIRAYYICRECFPDAYVQFSEQLRRRTTRDELEEFALTTLNERIYPPIDDLEHVLYGLPTVYQAIGWEEGLYIETYPEILPFLKNYFRVTPNDDEAYVEAASIARHIANSLFKQKVQVYQDLHALVSWCFSCSGNTCVDYTEEEASDMSLEPMLWVKEDIQFNREMHEEADQMIAAAKDMIDLLETDALADIRHALKQNIQLIRRKLKGKKSNDHHANYAALCQWPDRPQDRFDDQADGDTEVL